MDEELDYMSDDFIKNCVESAGDVRPGLLKTHNEIRQHNLMKKSSENKILPAKVLQQEVLQESLKQPINSTNKGFSMLEKMGFKSGMGLGKNSSGIKEPIGLQIKNDKVGLGHKAAGQSRQQKKSGSKLDNLREEDFRAFQSRKTRERFIVSDFRKSQRVCKELDIKHEKNKPEEPWFWAEEETHESSEEEEEEKEEENDSDDIELSDSDKLELLTKYLRETYFYCIWCKIQYEDEKDMEGCPGQTRDDH